MRKARQLRVAKGLTLAQVYKLTDVDDSHMSKYERGLAELSLPTMRILAALYGCSLDDLDAEVPEAETVAGGAVSVLDSSD